MHFERRLNLWAVVAISISSMLGSGIFVLPGVAIGLSGPSLWLAYILAGVCVLPAAMSKAELATAMPTSGGTYVYLERTFGPLVGTTAGFGLWLSLLLKGAFALEGVGAYLSVVADVPLNVVALTLLAIIVLINILGVGKVSGTVIAIVVLSLVSLAAVGGISAFHFDPANTTPMMPEGTAGLFAAAGLVFVSYAGVTKVAAIAEEIKEPEVTLPRAILISLFGVVFVYASISFLLVGAIPYESLVGNLKPIYTLAEATGGPAFGLVIAAVAILTMASMANSGLLAASRFPFAMSRDDLLPKKLGHVNRKFLTPVVSIMASGAIVAIAIIGLDVARIAKLASVFILIVYVLENVAIIVLRETRVQWYAPRYQAPLYPYLQVVGVASGLVLLAGMGATVIAAIAGMAIPGVAIYLYYGRRRTARRGVVGIRSRRRDLVADPSSLRKADYEDLLKEDASVVVALFGGERSPEMLVELGIALAHGGKVEVVQLKEVPEQTGLHDLPEESAELRSLRRRITAMSEQLAAEIQTDTAFSHDIFRTVHEISRRLHCNWLVKEWGGKTRGAFTMNNQMGWLESHLACHVVTFRDRGVRYIRDIIAYLDPDGPDRLVPETAEHLAMVHNAHITFATAVPAGASEKKVAAAERYLTEASMGCRYDSHTLLLRGGNETDALLARTAEHDLLVVQSPRNVPLGKRLFGTEQDRLMARAACSVVSVQSSPLPRG